MANIDIWVPLSSSHNFGCPLPIANYPITYECDHRGFGSNQNPSHCSRPLGYNCHNLPFIDDKEKECIKHISDENVGMEDDRVCYGAST